MDLININNPYFEHKVLICGLFYFWTTHYQGVQALAADFLPSGHMSINWGEALWCGWLDEVKIQVPPHQTWNKHFFYGPGFMHWVYYIILISFII